MPPAKPIEVLYCCSDSERDEDMRQQLEKHLKILQRQGVINTWHKGMIGAGKEWKRETDTQLMTADVILLLISSDFFVSDYNWNVVLKMARQRHQAGTARIIPILLRRVDNWKVVFGNLKLKALPEGERPVTDWKPYDKAFESITKGIRDLVEELTASPFSLKSYPQLRAGVTAVKRTLASVSTVTASLFPKRSSSRRRKRANLTNVITLVVIGVGGIIAINHLPHILRMPSLAPSLTSNSTQNIIPIGWIRIGVVNNTSSSLSGEPLIQSSNSLDSSVDSPFVPSIGAIVTVRNRVNLRKDRQKPDLPDLPQSIAELKPGEKLVIVKVEPLIIPPRKHVWAQVGRCNQACNR